MRNAMSHTTGDDTLAALRPEHLRALMYLAKDGSLRMPMPWTRQDIDCWELHRTYPDLCHSQFRLGGYEYSLTQAGMAARTSLVDRKKAERVRLLTGLGQRGWGMIRSQAARLAGRLSPPVHPSLDVADLGDCEGISETLGA